MNVMRFGELQEAVSDLMTQTLGLRGILDLYNVSKTDYVNEGGEVYGPAAKAALEDMRETLAEIDRLLTSE